MKNKKDSKGVKKVRLVFGQLPIAKVPMWKDRHHNDSDRKRLHAFLMKKLKNKAVVHSICSWIGKNYQ